MYVQFNFDTDKPSDAMMLSHMFSAFGPVPQAVDVTPDAKPEPEKAKPKKAAPKRKAKAKPKAEAKVAGNIEPKTTAPAEGEVTFDDVRAAFMQYVQANDTEAGMKALHAVDAKRLSHVTPDKFGELMAILSAS